MFTFDNISNHAYFAENALLARKINLNIYEKQPQIKNSFNNTTQQMQSMVFSNDYLEVSL